MKVISYMEENIKNLVIINDPSVLHEQDIVAELNKYWKSINIVFIDVSVLPSWFISILNKLTTKNNVNTINIGTNSNYLSNYLHDLGIPHKHYRDTNENYKLNEYNANIEINQIKTFLNDLFEVFGNDFRFYSYSGIYTVINRIMQRKSLTDFFKFRELIFGDNEFYSFFIDSMSVNFSSFFRDGEFYKLLRSDIFKKMGSKFQFKIWSAGCSNGMEPYSIAIILHEMGLLDRCVIYATDFNRNILEIAKNGAYSKNIIEKLQDNYLASGGKLSVLDYFENHGSYIEIKSSFKNKVNFFKHDLTNDKMFNEFEIILCRNVFIYFDDKLKKKVLDLFYDSMSDDGYLGFGSAESIHLYNGVNKFLQYKSGFNIYRKLFKGLLEVRGIE